MMMTTKGKKGNRGRRGTCADFEFGEFPFLDGVPSADAIKVKVLQAELRRIGEALDDPRVDLTMTMSEAIMELHQQLAERDEQISDLTISADTYFAERNSARDVWRRASKDRDELRQQLIGLSNRVKDECAALCYEQNWELRGEEMAEMILATKEEVK